MSHTKARNPIQYLFFEGLSAPICLKGSEELVPLIEIIIPNWHFTKTTSLPDNPPCMSIVAEDDGMFSCSQTQGTPKKWDAVNAVCEMIVELAWEQIRSNPSWLCLHCAAVEFNGRLVLFPNKRKAGKSTLTAVLASRGYRVFTDDFLPIIIDDKGFISGYANGILPRIRLPFPISFSEDFERWVAENNGPQNEKYKYLSIDNLAERAEILPIGGVVVLDRDLDAASSLYEITRQSALDDMISQNFARTMHSGKILQAINGVTETAELYRLEYSSAESAADLLEQTFQEWSEPVEPVAETHPFTNETVDLERLAEKRPSLDERLDYSQAPSLTKVSVGDATYLTDAHGLGVHRLNSGSTTVWKLFEEPAALNDVIEIFRLAFPDIPLNNIEANTRQSMSFFVENHLLVPSEDLEQASL